MSNVMKYLLIFVLAFVATLQGVAGTQSQSNGNEKVLNFAHLSLPAGKRIAAIRMDLYGVKISAFPKIPPDWEISLKLDGGYRARILGGCQHGVGLLNSSNELNGIIQATAEDWNEARVEGSVFVTTDFEALEEIKIDKATIAFEEISKPAKPVMEAIVMPTPHILVGTGCGDIEATELWLIDRETGQREFVLRGREDADLKKTIADIAGPVFSLDRKSIYFVSAAWATSGSIQRVDLNTKQVVFVIDGNSVDIITDGIYKGMLLVDRALIKFDKNGESLGRDSYLWLVSADGKPVREIGQTDEADAVKFRAEQLKKAAKHE